MKTELEEAKELVDKFIYTNGNSFFAKECAIIAVDLHLTELSKMELIFSDREIHYKRWNNIRKKIEKMV